MSKQVIVPALGESVAEATVLRWLKQAGAAVEAGEPLLEISTDKVDTEVPAPYSGVLTEILAPEDTVVPVGGPLAVIVEAADVAPDPARSAGAPAPGPAEMAGWTEATTGAPATGRRVTPFVRRLAREHGIDPAALTGTGAAGRVRRHDVLEAVATRTASTATASYPATPFVRRLAREHGVDLATVRGTAAGGRIRREDVIAAAEASASCAASPLSSPDGTLEDAPPPASTADVRTIESPLRAAHSPARGRSTRMSRLRQVIARRMLESLRVSAQLTCVVEADVTALTAHRDRVKDEFGRREGVRLTLLPFFVRATADALKKHPLLNASIDGDEVVHHDRQHIAFAVDTESGLVAPVVRNAGELNISGIARAITDLAGRARSGSLSADDLDGGTFTVSNTGSRGALLDTPIINQPQVGILATGSVVRRPAVVVDRDGQERIAIRSIMNLALTYDHRLIDGADAARFLTAIKEQLEHGDFDGA